MKNRKNDVIEVQWHPDVIISQEAILSYLQYFGNFLPNKLSELVDLDDYSKKLIRFADVAVSFINEEPAGMLAMYANDLNTRVAFISMLSVSPNYRCRGVGTSLISESIERAQIFRMSSITLKVKPDNTEALGLYKSFGFRLVDVLPDRILMKIDL